MNIFTSLGIAILIMFILAFLQFIPSIFLLFEHYTYGQNSRTKAAKLSFFFIAGVYFATALLYLLIYFIIASSSMIAYLDRSVYAWIFSGIFIAYCFIMFFLYYRRGKGTELFVSRKITQKYTWAAIHSKTSSEAFFLGITSIIPELLFTLPLFICSTIELGVFEANIIPKIIIIVLTILSSIIPLLAIYSAYTNHYNLVIIQKFRVKNKPFIKLFLGLLYLLIAVIIIAFRIIA
ncbi:hypothetical protein IJG26_00015 [Candidatus Saccharibacteria bacterium]|nr:hypothetical protein [Candidatus Saccharibacteria bacterium]